MAISRAFYAVLCIALVGGAQCAAAVRVMPHQIPEVGNQRSLLVDVPDVTGLTPVTPGAAVGLLTTLGLLLGPVVDVGAGEQLGDALDLTALSNFLKNTLVSIVPELAPVLDSLLGATGTNIDEVFAPTLKGGALDVLLVGLVDTLKLLAVLPSDPSGADVVAALKPLLDGVNNFVGTDNTVPGLANIFNVENLVNALKLPIDGADLEDTVDATKINSLLAQLVAAVINGLEAAVASIPAADAPKVTSGTSVVSSVLSLLESILGGGGVDLPSTSVLNGQLKGVKKTLNLKKIASITAKLN